jgi:hypothetical protein
MNLFTSLGTIQSKRTLSRSTGIMIAMAFWTVPAVVMAHAGHDHEFAGGNAEQIMQPLTIDPAAANALGLKTTALGAGNPPRVPANSVVEANGNQLVYVLQPNSIYKPVAIKSSKTTGDQIELAEGNLKTGDQVVTQGATLLYSEALRRKPQVAIEAPHTHGPFDGISPKKRVLGMGAGILTGLGIMYGLSNLRKSKNT